MVTVEHIAAYNFVTFFFSFSLFCYGYFPLSFSPTTKCNVDDLPQSIENVRFSAIDYKPHTSRVIFMVLDALRMDFVQQAQNFPFVNKLINENRACLYRLQVHPPTVTMPRIKALTSGALPSFLDVVLNLGGSEMELDTFLYQMRQRQQKIVFYGDNTWARMFPNMFHRKGENADSLFVYDFHEGDRNITNSLNAELEADDWSLLILHYLGLDHIGHVEGPFSEKVPKKLQEMDKVVETIFAALNKWPHHTNPLVVLTGDHGMRDSGGHGGSSTAETIVPLLVISNQCSKSDETYLQIDLAPTMSALLGLPIPFSSIGGMIEPMFDRWAAKDILYALYYNTQRLVTKAKAFLEAGHQTHETYQQYEEAKRMHQTMINNEFSSLSGFQRAISLYKTVTKNMSQLLITNYIRYDITYIVIGLLMMVSCAVIAVGQFGHLTTSVESREISFRVQLLPAVCFLMISFILLKILTCVWPHVISMKPVDVLSAITSFIFLTHFLLLKFFISNTKARLLVKFLKRTLPSLGILWIGIMFHCVSLTSSSFIEEEHQTWYYVTNTVMLMLALRQLSIMNHTIGSLLVHTKADKSLISICKGERNGYCIHSLAILCMHIFIRRLNQTGDKWQHIPDIGDWLVMSGHKVWLSIMLIFGLAHLVYQLSFLSGLPGNVLSATAALLIYYYRAMSGTVHLFGQETSYSSVCVTLFWINLLEIFLIGLLPLLYYRMVKGKKTNDNDMNQFFGHCTKVIILLVALLSKPHNVMLLGAIIASSRYITRSIDRVADRTDTNLALKIITHYWLGKAYYFYQGNSNSLATIDVNAGYVGLEHFHMFRVGFFLTLQTFCGPVISFLMLVHHLRISQQSYNHLQHNHSETPKRRWVLIILNAMVMLPATCFVIVATLLRDHLFVWTVFSPKIMYEYFNLLIVSIQIVLVMWLLPTQRNQEKEIHN